MIALRDRHVSRDGVAAAHLAVDPADPMLAARVSESIDAMMPSGRPARRKRSAAMSRTDLRAVPMCAAAPCSVPSSAKIRTYGVRAAT
jgi:hypothetical protein